MLTEGQLRLLNSSGNCDDTQTQQIIMQLSEKGLNTFAYWVTGFFKKRISDFGSITPREVSVSEVKDGIFGPDASCTSFINASVPEDDEDPNGNTNINFSVDNGPFIPSYFSISLFRGFFNIQLFPVAPDKFYFYKALVVQYDDSGKVATAVATIFSIKDVAGNMTYWDLSNTVPPGR